MKINVKRVDEGKTCQIPAYESAGASGVDLRANIPESITMQPGAGALVPTGLAFAIPHGYEGQVRPRSGLALKHRLMVVNSPGTIDADYRGELKVILANFGDQPFVVEPGMRIAQLVICPVVQAEFVEVENLDDTDRGAGGFGSTGVV